MTILKSELIAVVNGTLKRAYTGTQLDTKITSSLVDLSKRGDFLQDEFKRATIGDRDYYSLPDNFKNLLFVGMKSSDDVTLYKPLEYERFAMYKRNIYYCNTSGTPERYTWQTGYMYPRPIPDTVYNMYLWYSYIHPETIGEDKACDSILFTDTYRKAIELRLLYEVADSLDLDDAQKYNTLYLVDEIPLLKSTLKEHADIAYYRDGF